MDLSTYTTRSQQALAAAVQAAAASGNPAVEPAHLLDALLSQRPEGTGIVEPPTRVQRSGLTVVESRYVHRTGGLWESAVVLIAGNTGGSAAEILRIDVLLHAGASGAWRGLATEVAASAAPPGSARE